MKRIISLICVFVLGLLMLTGCGGTDNDTVVTVNGEKVSVGEFECYMYLIKNTIISSGGEDTEEYWNTFEIEGKKAGDVVKDTALKNAIEYTLLAQKAVEAGVDSSEDTKAEQRKNYIEQMFGGDEASYIARISEIGFTDRDFTEIIMNDYLAREYYNRNVLPEVTDNQVKEYYNKNYFRAKHILIAISNYVSDTSDGQKEAFAKAKEVKAKLDAGESFESLFNVYNEDLGMEDNETGYVFAKNTIMPKNFEDAVEALEIGDISDIVETDYGYHIIKRLDAEKVFEKYVTSFSELFADGTTTGRDEIAALVDNARRMNTLEGFKQEADIKINNAVLDAVMVVKPVIEKTEE